MNVLSLFNGCGMLRPALEKTGIKVDNYYSSEIDKYSNQISNKNYPSTIQLGDVKKWSDWDLKKIDLLTAGFPCQDLSSAGKGKGLNGERSGLLFEVLKIKKALNPKHFLFENVASMSNKWRDEITKLVGVNPVQLNSKFWGAQNRERLFWTNIPGAKNIELLQQTNDKKIYLKDILIDGFVDISNSNNCFDKQLVLGNVNPSGKGMNGNVFFAQGKSPSLTTNKGEGIKILKTKFNVDCLKIISQQDYEKLFISSEKTLKIINQDSFCCGLNKRQNGGRFKKDGKSFTLTAQDKHRVFFSEPGIRKLHPIECERLMNLPDNYTHDVSNSQRYKMLGNGWDVHVVAELLKGINTKAKDIQPDLFAEVIA